MSTKVDTYRIVAVSTKVDTYRIVAVSTKVDTHRVVANPGWRPCRLTPRCRPVP
ncbi:MAG: hypothetical protein PBU97_07125 [Stenotrophomonas maltophilia]